MVVAEDIIALGHNAPLQGLDGDLDDTAEMTKLNNEIEQSQSVSNPRPINWNLVEQCSRIILRDYVKHYQVASLYAKSLINLNPGFKAIAEGAVVFDEISKTFWNEALPPIKRKKGRFAQVSSWVEVVEEFVSSYEGPEVESDLIAEVKDCIKNLDSTLAEIDEDLAPNFRPILNQLDRVPIKETVVEPEPTPEPVVASSTSTSEEVSTSDASSSVSNTATNQEIQQSENTQTTPSVAPVEVPKPQVQVAPKVSQSTTSAAPVKPIDVPIAENAAQKVKIGLNFLVDAANDIFAENKFNPEGYSLRRIGTWNKVKALPYNDNNVTRIPVPSDEIRNALEKLLIGNQYDKLLESSEQRVSQYIYWLDLSYYSYKSLMELSQKDCANAIAIELRTFITKFPQVVDLCFDDGTPMSNSDAKSWIISLMAATGSDSENNAATDPVETHIKEAINLSFKDMKQAINLLEQLIKTSSSLDLMRYETALARVFSMNKRHDLAVGIINKIKGELQSNSLDKWNKKETAEIYSTAFDIFRDAEMLPEATKILTELATIAPSIAIMKKYTQD